MKPEDKKLNKEYYRLLEKYGKLNTELVTIKKRMAEIRTKIIPCEVMDYEREDLIIMKHEA